MENFKCGDRVKSLRTMDNFYMNGDSAIGCWSSDLTEIVVDFGDFGTVVDLSPLGLMDVRFDGQGHKWCVSGDDMCKVIVW